MKSQNILAPLQVAGRIVSDLEDQGAGHWLDHGTEHPHRIALSIRADMVPHAVHSLSSGFAHEGLQVPFILLSLTVHWKVILQQGCILNWEAVRCFIGPWHPQLDW